MTNSAGYKCLLMSFHGIEGVSYSVHSLPTKEKEQLTAAAWKKVTVGMAKGLQCLHSHDKGAILHNDLRYDNVILDASFDCFEPCIVDFDKPCFRQNAKLYVIGSEKRDHFVLESIFQYSAIKAPGSYIR